MFSICTAVRILKGIYLDFFYRKHFEDFAKRNHLASIGTVNIQLTNKPTTLHLIQTQSYYTNTFPLVMIMHLVKESQKL